MIDTADVPAQHGDLLPGGDLDDADLAVSGTAEQERAVGREGNRQDVVPLARELGDTLAPFHIEQVEATAPAVPVL